MNKLWAPWRINYVKHKVKTKGCVFCQAKKNNSGDYVIFKTKKSICLLNIYPYNNGHVMVAPYRHIKSIDLLTEAELIDLMKLVTRTKTNIDKKLKPHGYNIGMNIGKVAGAGFAGHIHIHIVPRWMGDTNFMPVVADVRVIPEAVDATYQRMKKEF